MSSLKRIFFALWPDEALRSQINKSLSSLLIAHAKNHMAKRVPVRNWHITLAFIGDVRLETGEAMQQQIDQLDPISSFDLQLDTLGFFKRAHVAWLGCTNNPVELQQLVTSLNSALEPCGYSPDYPEYTPHLTLLRKARRGIKTEQSYKFDWKVREFVLVESSITSASNEYKVLRRWPLV